MKQRLLMLLSVFMAVTSVGWLHAAETSPSINTDLRFVKPGVPVVSGITTKKGNVAAETQVRVKLEVTDEGGKGISLEGWKLRYYEVNEQPQVWKDWEPENGAYMFGVQAGFPFMDITAYVEVTAPTGSVGTYKANLTVLNATNQESVVTSTSPFMVTANPENEESYKVTPMASIGNTDYASIYTAVEFAKNDETIQLTEGNYSLYKSLVITKPLTISGAGMDANGSTIQKHADKWEIPAGQETGNARKHLIVIGGDAKGTVILQNMNVVGSVASGIIAESAMTTVLDKVGMANNTHAGLVVHSEVKATGIYTVDNIRGGVNVDEASAADYAPSFTFDATSKFDESSKIWSELIDAEPSTLVSAPEGWRNYIQAEKKQRFWTNASLSIEVKDAAALKAAITNTQPGQIITLTGNEYGTEGAIQPFGAVKAANVTIKAKDATKKPKVYGTIKVLAEGCTIEGLEMYTKSDGSAGLKNIIDVVAMSATIKDNVFNMLEPTKGNVCNALNIWPFGSDEATNYVIEGNVFNAFNATVTGWSSTGLLITEGVELSRFGLTAQDISKAVTIADEISLWTKNTFTNCYSDFVHSNWTEGDNNANEAPFYKFTALGNGNANALFTAMNRADAKAPVYVDGIYQLSKALNSKGEFKDWTFTEAINLQSIDANKKATLVGCLTFINDGTVLNNLKLESESTGTKYWEKNTVSVIGKSITITNCDFAGSVSANTFVSNGVVLFPTDATPSFDIKGNVFNGYKAKTADNWVSTALLVSDGFELTKKNNENVTLPAATLKDAELANGNTYKDCFADYTHLSNATYKFASASNQKAVTDALNSSMMANGGTIQAKALDMAGVVAAFNAVTEKSDLAEVKLTVEYKDGIIATNKDDAKALLKAGKNVQLLSYAESTYAAKAYTQELAAITNLPASVVYGTAPIELAFNMDKVTATIEDGSGVASIETKETKETKSTLTILKPGTVTITLAVSEDADASSTQTLTVKPRTVKVSGLSIEAKTYDGTNEVTLVTGSVKFEGTIGEKTNLSLNTPVGTLDDANAGKNKTVTVKATLDGTDKDYYELAPISFNAEVKPKAFTITADAKSSDYGTIPAYTVADYSNNLETGDVLEGVLKFDCAATATSPEGTYDIKPYGLSNPNYAITYAAGKLTIEAVNPTVKIIGQKVAVSGQKRDITVTAQITNYGGAKKDGGEVTESVSFTYNNVKESLEGKKNADGTYSATTTVEAAASTYNFTATATVTGSAAKTSDASNAISVAIDDLTPQNISFDKSVVSTLMYGKSMKLAATGSVIANAAYTYELTDASNAYATLADGVLTATKVGEVTIVAKQAGDETHSAATATKTIQVTAQPITVTVGAITKSYDGKTTLTALPTFTLVGQKADAQVSVETPKLQDFAFANKNVGSSLVSCPTLTLAGTDATNYTLVQPKKEDVKGSITKAPLIVKVDDVTRMYNDRYTKYTFSVVEGTLFNGETLATAYSGTFDVKEKGEILELSVQSALCPNYDLKAENGKLTINKGNPVAVVYGVAGRINAMLIDQAGYTNLDVVLSEDRTYANISVGGSVVGRSINTIAATTEPVVNTFSRMLTKASDNWDSEKAESKVYGDDSFTSAYSVGEGFSYLSTNTDILTVSKNGMVTINGTGDAAIIAMKESEAHVIKYKVAAKTLDVAVANMDKTYDGTTLATGTIALGDGVKDVDVALDMSGVSFNYASEKVAEGVTVNPSQALILTGTAANNYDLKVTLKGTISKKDLNITSVSKYYDGLATATLTDYATTDLVNGDIVPATVTFSSANIDATLASVTIAENSNYALTSVLSAEAQKVVTTGSILKSTIIAKLPTEGSSESNVKGKITLKVKETGADITNASALNAIKASIKVEANGSNAYFVSAEANDNFTIMFDGSQQIGYRAEEDGGGDDVIATDITLDRTELTLKPNDTYALIATITPSAGKTISWTSSNDLVATVDADGTVTAIAIGEATITASVDGKSATCKVTVSNVVGIEDTIANTRVYSQDRTICIEPAAPIKVMVLNMTGALVYNGLVTSFTQIPVSATGVYAVKIGTENDTFVHKISVK